MTDLTTRSEATPDAAQEAAWRQLWDCLLAETAADAPDSDAEPDAGRLLLLVESDDDVR